MVVHGTQGRKRTREDLSEEVKRKKIPLPLRGPQETDKADSHMEASMNGTESEVVRHPVVVVTIATKPTGDTAHPAPQENTVTNVQPPGVDTVQSAAGHAALRQVQSGECRLGAVRLRSETCRKHRAVRVGEILAWCSERIERDAIIGVNFREEGKLSIALL